MTKAAQFGPGPHLYRQDRSEGERARFSPSSSRRCEADIDWAGSKGVEAGQRVPDLYLASRRGLSAPNSVADEIKVAGLVARNRRLPRPAAWHALGAREDCEPMDALRAGASGRRCAPRAQLALEHIWCRSTQPGCRRQDPARAKTKC